MLDTKRPERPIRAAVVGLGYWGPNLARNLATAPGFELSALCDLKPERVAKIGALWPAARRCSSLDEILQDPPDLVAVAVPVAAHHAVAAACLRAGSHVLLEKPMTATVAEAEDLLRLAESAGRRVFVDHTFLFTGAVEEVRKQVQGGALGKLLYVDSVRINLGLFQPDVDVIWDLAPHDLSILHWVVGRTPVSVSAMGASHNPWGFSDVAYLHLDYGEGLTAHLHLSWLSPVKVRRMIFAGEKQSLIFDDLDADAKIKLFDHGVAFDVNDLESRRDILVSYRKGDMRAPAVPTKEALGEEIREIGAVILGRGEPRADGLSGLDVVRILEASSVSLASGGRVFRL